MKIEVVDVASMALPGIQVLDAAAQTWRIADPGKLQGFRAGDSGWMLFPRTSDLSLWAGNYARPLLVQVNGQTNAGPWPVRDLLPGERLGKLGPFDSSLHVLRDVPEPSDAAGFTADDRAMLNKIAAALGVGK